MNLILRKVITTGNGALESAPNRQPGKAALQVGDYAQGVSCPGTALHIFLYDACAKAYILVVF
jgi:hypothetical protein